MVRLLKPVHLFWSAIALLAYTYLVFPVILVIRAALWPRPVVRRPIEPSVSVLIAARNEAASIGQRLSNLADVDYPQRQLDVILASDGSTDATVAEAEAVGMPNLRILALPPNGKAAALNAAVAASQGEILVFTDANSTFRRDAIRQLVAPFADAAVGGVAGDQRYRGAAGEAGGEQTYWNLDRLLKRAESAAGNTISATGAIYAIRRSTFTQIPADVTDDFYTSTGVIAAGQRLVFSPDAVAWEEPAASDAAEFQRKVRIMTRGLQGVVERRALLNPLHHGFYAIQLLTHKVLRRVTFAPLTVLALTTPILARKPAYRPILIAQILAYLLAAAGLASPVLRKRKPFGLAAFFVLSNVAAARAVGNVVTGRRITRWTPPRHAPYDEDPS
jgi:cellulose synthase/poly-beta-1,6-N-acetylglucosamine synthase-like glycosyltransferase